MDLTISRECSLLPTLQLGSPPHTFAEPFLQSSKDQQLSTGLLVRRDALPVMTATFEVTNVGSRAHLDGSHAPCSTNTSTLCAVANSSGL